MAKAYRWEDVRAERVQTPEDEARVAAVRAELAAEQRAYRLREIRETYGLKQTDVAERLGVDQSRVSRIERGDLDHTELGTLKGYIEVMGGEVEVIARFGGDPVRVG